MNTIRQTILQKLTDTETLHAVRIPLAIESGSRGWGFASPDSDYDCRFIYVHTPEWYLSIQEKKDFIEYAADPVYDINGWDLKKFLQHLMKSNAVVFEWLSSNEIYRQNKAIVDPIRYLAAEFFNPVTVSHHYLSIAKKKYDELITQQECKLKTYFYILRPIANLQYIRQYHGIPPMEYDQTLANIELHSDILSAIQELKDKKQNEAESFRVPQNPFFIAYFQKEILSYEEYLKEMTHLKNKSYDKIDAVFRAVIQEMYS